MPNSKNKPVLGCLHVIKKSGFLKRHLNMHTWDYHDLDDLEFHSQAQALNSSLSTIIKVNTPNWIELFVSFILT